MTKEPAARFQKQSSQISLNLILCAALGLEKTDVLLLSSSKTWSSSTKLDVWVVSVTLNFQKDFL